MTELPLRTDTTQGPQGPLFRVHQWRSYPLEWVETYTQAHFFAVDPIVVLHAKEYAHLVG